MSGEGGVVSAERVRNTNYKYNKDIENTQEESTHGLG